MAQSLETALLPRGVVRPLALAADVYTAILDRIMCLQLAPGSKINIDQLARDLGVSHTPVREALGRLEVDGLVIKTHLVGYSAAPQLSRAQVEHLFELRLLLEPAAAAKAAIVLTNDEKTFLAELQTDMGGLVGGQYPNYGVFACKDAELHSVIAKASGNPLLSDTLSRLHAHLHIFRLVLNTRVTSEAVGEHAELLHALERGDVRSAERAMRNHIRASRNRILSLRPS